MTEPMNSGNPNTDNRPDVQGQSVPVSQGNQTYAGQAPTQGFTPQGFASAPHTAPAVGYGYQPTSQQPYPQQQYFAATPGYAVNQQGNGFFGTLFSLNFGSGPRAAAARTVHLLALITGGLLAFSGLFIFIDSFSNSYYSTSLVFKLIFEGFANIALGLFILAFSRAVMEHVVREGKEEKTDAQA